MAKPSPELAALFTPVLKWLDAGGDDQYKFDMRYHFHKTDCGTSCCIVGALSVFNREKLSSLVAVPGESKKDYLEDFAICTDDALVKHFDMTRQDVEELFYMRMGAKPAEAAETIRRWIETGDVQWPNPFYGDWG